MVPSSRDDQHPEGARIRPAPRGGLHQRAGQRPHADHEQHASEQVGHGLVGAAPVVCQRSAPEHPCQHPDRKVHHEHPPPAQVDQQPAQERTGYCGEPSGRRPASGCRDPASGVDRAEQQCERGRHQRGGSGRLHDTRHHQHRDVRGHGAGQRCDREDRDAAEEHPPVPDAVAEPPGGDQQRRECDRVGVQYPGQVRERPAERALHADERHVDDPQVQVRHEDRGDRHHDDADELRAPTHEAIRLAADMHIESWSRPTIATELLYAT